MSPIDGAGRARAELPKTILIAMFGACRRRGSDSTIGVRRARLAKPRSSAPVSASGGTAASSRFCSEVAVGKA